MDAEKLIADLKKDWALRYGLAVMDIEVKVRDEVVTVRGCVLSENQADATMKRVKDAFPQLQVLSQLRVLSDPAEKPLAFAKVKQPTALKGRYVASKLLNQKILRRIVTSNLPVGTIVRILFKQEDQALVQTDTLLLGWVEQNDLVEITETAGTAVWQKLKIPPAGKTLIDPEFKAQQVLQAAEKLLGVPYAWGQNSTVGLDCSALTQLSYRHVDILIPRHSWDQKRLGVPMTETQACDGDLVFFLNRQNGRRHVGLWDGREKEPHLLHACLAEGAVVRQPLVDVKRNYDLVAIKRLIVEK